jgi:hypothetical protein
VNIHPPAPAEWQVAPIDAVRAIPEDQLRNKVRAHLAPTLPDTALPF